MKGLKRFTKASNLIIYVLLPFILSCAENNSYDSGSVLKDLVIADSTTITDDITIYFQKPHSWKKAWIWYDKGNDALWETQVLKESPEIMENNRPGWYKKTIHDTDIVKFLFNNGTSNKWVKWRQKEGIDFVTYKDIWITAEGDKFFVDPVKDLTFYFKKPLWWHAGNPRIYTWLGDDNATIELSGNWPGTQMVAAGEIGADWYKYTIRDQVKVNLIFTDGVNQTEDLVRVKTGYFKQNSWYNGNPDGHLILRDDYSMPPDDHSVPITVNKLGADYHIGYTTFAIWSPDTHDVTVTVAGKEYRCQPTHDFDGYTDIYAAKVYGNLHLAEYQFKINGINVRDPYGVMVKYEKGEPISYKENNKYRVTADVGSSVNIVIDLDQTEPDGGWVKVGSTLDIPDPYQEREDAIIYEVHIGDFTVDQTSGVDQNKRGKFSGMIQPKTSYKGRATGLEHLKELGITHVQIMPFYDFATKINHDAGDTDYNWGYDPINYNVPEDRYAMNPDNYVDRIKEVKTMINELHKNGIRVIMDVVYNHTFMPEMFDAITQKYYDGKDRSSCSNSIDTSNKMVARFIRDSLEYWIKEYNVDGFRFDLIGIFQYEVVKDWATYLNDKYPNKKLIIYGEPWEGGAGSNIDNRVRLGKMSHLASAHVGAFNNQFRYAIKGGSDDGSKGYMFNHTYGDRNVIDIEIGMKGSLTRSAKIKNRGEWEKQFAIDPEQTINYITAHDNYNLYDKISEAKISDNGYARRIGKFGNGIVLTSQGIPFIHYGEEFGRTKAVGDYKQHKKNSYMWGVEMNKINWDYKDANFDRIFQYYKDLIALRKAHPGLRLRTREEINTRITKNYIIWDRNIVVAEIDEDHNIKNGPELLVVYNPSSDYNVNLPHGNWRKIFDINGKTNVLGNSKCEGTAVTIFEKISL